MEATPPLPAIRWPGLSPERSFVLPLPATRMTAPFGGICEIDDIRLKRKTEFHVTVLNREMVRAAVAGMGEDLLRALYGSLTWAPRRSGRYVLLHEARTADASALDCWSLIEPLQLPAMHAFRGALAHRIDPSFADLVPHVTHYVHGDPNGIGVPDTRALAALRVRDVAP
ncbi:hypothetical protein [Frateuria soli]|uniref:hypothetical protein n=1 Tax=Frateuria soli TaxID=1542730 RepID=UPI001E3426B8|nr:hypothetical protein [Frateuria soli]UGB37159.1 hypothetical protein LQ771_09955 [Frateuria soli]